MQLQFYSVMSLMFEMIDAPGLPDCLFEESNIYTMMLKRNFLSCNISVYLFSSIISFLVDFYIV